MLSGIGISGRILHYNLLDLSFEHTKEWHRYYYADFSDLWGALQIFQQSNNGSKLFFFFCPKVFSAWNEYFIADTVVVRNVECILIFNF